MTTPEQFPSNPFLLPPDARLGIAIAHPDDEFFLAHAIRSATTLALAGRIEAVHAFVASNGEASTLGDNRNRPKEALASLGYLGINAEYVQFGKRPDGGLVADPELIDSTRDFIKRNELTGVVTLGEASDGHTDHAAVHYAVLETASKDMAVWALNGQHQGTVQVSGQRRHKLEVMKHHPSQFSVTDGSEAESYVTDEYTESVLERYTGYLRRETYDRKTDDTLY